MLFFRGFLLLFILEFYHCASSKLNGTHTGWSYGSNLNDSQRLGVKIITQYVICPIDNSSSVSHRKPYLYRTTVNQFSWPPLNGSIQNDRSDNSSIDLPNGPTKDTTHAIVEASPKEPSYTAYATENGPSGGPVSGLHNNPIYGPPNDIMYHQQGGLMLNNRPPNGPIHGTPSDPMYSQPNVPINPPPNWPMYGTPNDPLNFSPNGPMHRPFHRQMHPPFYGPNQRPFHGPIHRPFHPPINGPSYSPMPSPVNGQTYGPLNGPMHSPSNGMMYNPFNGPLFGPPVGPMYNPPNNPIYGASNGPMYVSPR